MNEEQMLEVILQNTFTKQVLLTRLRLLRQYYQRKFFSGRQETLEQYLKDSEVSDETVRAMMSWTEEFYKQFSQKNLYRLILGITEKASNLPHVTVYLPFLPGVEESAGIGTWFRQHVNPRMLVDVRYDPDAVGGCSIVNLGHYYDYSLRYYLNKQRDALIQIFNTYAS